MSNAKKDITTREDIEVLMNTFYGRLLADENISYIFIDTGSSGNIIPPDNTSISN